MKKLVVIIIALIFVQSASAQIGAKLKKEEGKEVAFNMTTLTKKLMPFNAGTSGFQNYAMQFRMPVNKDKLFFNTAFGFNMNVLENDENIMHFDFRIGLETRKYFGQNWFFGSGYNLVAYAHEIENNNFFGDDLDGGIAFDKSFLLGYKINEHLSVFTETSLQFGISSASFIKLEFLSPSAIYLNVKF